MTTTNGRPSRFVRPEVDQLPITRGDTITVRRRLTNGERRGMFARMYITGGETLRVDTLQTGLAMVLAYLVDWTLTDDDGQIVAIRYLSAEELATVLDSLDPDTFTEIKEAVEQHIARQDAATAEEKKDLVTASVS